MTRLLLLTDRSQLRLGRSLTTTVRECVDAGLTHVVVREHDLPSVSRQTLISALARINGLSVISSRIVDPRADGVHLGSDQPVQGGRFGRSCHSSTEVASAAAEGAAWATLSPYAETASKPGYGPPLDPEAFAGHSIPVFALGGVTPANAAAALDAGAFGVAVMGAVMRADQPAVVVRDLLAVLR